MFSPVDLSSWGMLRPPPGNSRLFSGPTQQPYAGPSPLWIKTHRETPPNHGCQSKLTPLSLSPQIKQSKRCRSGSSTTYVAFSVTSRMQAGAVYQKQWKMIRNEKSKIKQLSSTDSQLSMMYFTISLLPKVTAWWRRVQPKRSWSNRLTPPSCIWTSWEHERAEERSMRSGNAER